MPTDLIARLQAAESGSQELDALIHQAVTPHLADAFPQDTGWIVGGNHFQPTKAPEYTTSVDAALTLVPEGWRLTMQYNIAYDDGVLMKGKCSARLHDPISSGGAPRWDGYGANLPLAICIATLRARSEP